MENDIFAPPNSDLLAEKPRSIAWSVFLWICIIYLGASTIQVFLSTLVFKQLTHYYPALQVSVVFIPNILKVICGIFLAIKSKKALAIMYITFPAEILVLFYSSMIFHIHITRMIDSLVVLNWLFLFAILVFSVAAKNKGVLK